MQRSVNLVIVGVFFHAVLLAAPVRAQGNESLQFVDREGNGIPEADVPDDLCAAVKRLPLSQIVVPGKPFALVLAQVVLPADEANPTYSSSLVGRGWHGGMHYLSEGGSHWDANLRNPVCIRLLDFDNPCTLNIEKMGYRLVSLAIPVSDAKGKVIWMGEIPLNRFDPEFGVLVRGEVATPVGQLLSATGEATIRVNGTNDCRKDSLKDGRFSFAGVTPGKYLVEFWIDTHSVATWWVTVPEGSGMVEKRLTAYPRKELKLKLHIESENTKDVSVRCGIPYRSAYLDGFPGTQLQISQEGESISLYTEKYKLAVAKGPFHGFGGSLLSLAPGSRPWYSWNGGLKKGDVIMLLDAGDSQREMVPISDKTRVVGVAEVMAIQDSAQPADGHGP
jgi:hypothetical protein